MDNEFPTVKTSKPNLTLSFQSVSDKPYCLLCEYAISEVDKLIEDKKNEDEIKAVLDRICYELRLEITYDSKGGCLG